MTTAIVIPARLKSTRFPDKMLLDFHGKPLIRRVFDICQTFGYDTYVLTDSKKIADVITKFNVIMTSEDCTNGTDRIMSVIGKELHYDKAKMDDHWWRVIDFLEVAGNGGVVFNADKFQASEEAVDFAGFCITEDTVEPLPKYIDAIRKYPIPKTTTDIRSWFGLVNQVCITHNCAASWNRSRHSSVQSQVRMVS